jgi:hypothetical protein
VLLQAKYSPSKLAVSIHVYPTLQETGTLPSAENGHSAKTNFAQCGARRNSALGKEVFTERQALGKVRHWAKFQFA